MKQVLIPPDLLPRIASGDEEAFEQLYNLTYRPVFSFLLSLTMNQDDAKDLLQETYLRVYGCAHMYREGNPMSWIMKISKNLFLMDRRKRKPQPVFGGKSENHVPVSLDCIEDVETRILLEQLFVKLTPEEREIVVMHITCGFRHREIAQILDKPLGTVLAKYNRAMKKLKKGADEAMEGVSDV